MNANRVTYIHTSNDSIARARARLVQGSGGGKRVINDLINGQKPPRKPDITARQLRFDFPATLSLSRLYIYIPSAYIYIREI